MMENINTSNSLEDPLEHILKEIQEHLNKIDNIKPENNKTENPRLQKGITLHQQGHVKQNKDPNTWTVKGQNTKTYNVEYIPEHGWICNCPDHTYRNKTCKHIHATKIQTSPNINLKREEEENISSSLTGDRISKNNNSKNYSDSFFRGLTITLTSSSLTSACQISLSPHLRFNILIISLGIITLVELLLTSDLPILLSYLNIITGYVFFIIYKTAYFHGEIHGCYHA